MQLYNIDTELIFLIIFSGVKLLLASKIKVLVYTLHVSTVCIYI